MYPGCVVGYLVEARGYFLIDVGIDLCPFWVPPDPSRDFRFGFFVRARLGAAGTLLKGAVAGVGRRHCMKLYMAYIF